MLVALIDGLNLLRRIHAAVPGDAATRDHADGVLESSRRSLARALAELSPTHALCAIDAPGETWRHRLHPGYKADRPPMPEDLAALMPEIEAAFAGLGVRAVRAEGFEADDVLATVAVKVSARGGRSVILSTDKSMLTLLGEGIGVRNHFGSVNLDAAHVVHRFGVPPERLAVVLALCGDRALGVPGVPGVGPKRAAALVERHGDLESILAAAADMPGRPGQALRAGAGDARLSLRLISPRTDVELGMNLSDFRVAPAPSDRPGGL